MALVRRVIQHSNCLRFVRYCSTNKNKSITGYDNFDRSLQTVTGGRVNLWIDAYEDFIGLTEVREAQTSVKQAEDAYKLIQEERRAAQQQLNAVQTRLKKITTELEKTRRGEDTYLELVTKENEIIKEEKVFVNQLESLEDKETSTLGAFSSALRESHEKERARAERMKYLSIIGSIIGACIGIIGAAVTNYRRMKELRKMVTSSADVSKSYGEQILEVSKAVNEQYEKVQESLSDMRTELGVKAAPQTKVSPVKSTTVAENTQSKLNELLQMVKRQEAFFEQEMNEIRKAFAAGAVNTNNSSSTDEKIVYVGPEVKSMLEETERKLEEKMERETTRSVGLSSFVSLASVAISVLVVMYGGNR